MTQDQSALKVQQESCLIFYTESKINCVGKLESPIHSEAPLCYCPGKYYGLLSTVIINILVIIRQSDRNVITVCRKTEM